MYFGLTDLFFEQINSSNILFAFKAKFVYSSTIITLFDNNRFLSTQNTQLIFIIPNLIKKKIKHMKIMLVAIKSALLKILCVNMISGTRVEWSLYLVRVNLKIDK